MSEEYFDRRFCSEVFLRARIYETCRFATERAQVHGLEFTPVYWYYGEDGKQPPVLTLWDMNPPKSDRAARATHIKTPLNYSMSWKRTTP